MNKILTRNGKIVIGDNNGLIVNSYLSTLAFLPDTQSYVNYKPSIMVSQIDYLINNKNNLNIKFVGHEGDIVQNHDNNPYIPTGTTFTPTGYTEWSFMQWQMNRLIENGIPYSTLPGNHDYIDGERESTMYNSYFPLSTFTEMTTYRGSYDGVNSDNTYHIVNMDGHNILILSLEIGPRTSVLEWANDILENNSTIPAILLTHAYLSKDNLLLDHDTNHAPSNGYGLGNGPPDVNDAIADTGITSIFRTLVEPNNNVKIVISGHDGSSDVGSKLLITGRTDGSIIYQILSNYQYFNVNNSGYLILFSFTEDKVHFSTYSPSLGSYLVNDYSHGDWDWNWNLDNTINFYVDNDYVENYFE